MGLKESDLMIFEKEHITHLCSVIFSLQTAHIKYADEIMREYTQRAGHSVRKMKSVHALQEYNQQCAKEIEHLGSEFPDQVYPAIVGSVRYGVAIPGLSDIDGAVIFQKGTTRGIKEDVQSRIDQISDAYGYENNMVPCVMDPNHYNFMQKLYSPVTQFGVQPSPNWKEQHRTLTSFLQVLTLQANGVDELGWDMYLEGYSKYFETKDKQPARYAQRALDIIGLQEFNSADDWMTYRENLRNTRSITPFDTEELQEMELFAQTGYLG